MEAAGEALDSDEANGGRKVERGGPIPRRKGGGLQPVGVCARRRFEVMRGAGESERDSDFVPDAGTDRRSGLAGFGGERGVPVCRLVAS